MANDASVQKMMDELEIRNLIARLAHLADDGDLDEYVSLFTEDGTWQVVPGGGLAPMPARQGRADIRAGAVERRAAGIQGPGTHTLHVLTTTAVSIAGDKAAAKSYMTLLINTDKKAEFGFAGIYADQYVRTTGGWKLASRLITPR